MKIQTHAQNLAAGNLVKLKRRYSMIHISLRALAWASFFGRFTPVELYSTPHKPAPNNFAARHVVLADPSLQGLKDLIRSGLLLGSSVAYHTLAKDRHCSCQVGEQRVVGGRMSGSSGESSAS